MIFFKREIPTARFLIAPVTLILTLVHLSDCIMSYSFPIILEKYVSSNTLMGLILSFASLTAIIIDFLFPSIFKQKSWKYLLVIAILGSITYPIIIYGGLVSQLILLFIVANIVWGAYYEFLCFATETFIANEEPKEEFTRSWGIITTFVDATAVVGPILGSILLAKSHITYIGLVVIFEVIALILVLIVHTAHRKATHTEDVRHKITDEIRYWIALGKRAYTAVTIGFLMSFIASTFWVLGGLYGKELTGASGFDWVVIVAFSLPSIIFDMIMAKLNIKKRKKRLSQLFMILAGVLLALLYFTAKSAVFSIILIALTSIALSISYILIKAVYSDLHRRLRKNMSHLQGLGSAVASFGYVLGPIVMGMVADELGYHNSFAALGVAVAIITCILLLLTPKKLKMPQKELAQLDNEIK